MAKSDSFFIRANVVPDDTDTYTTTQIDLGAYVDALGKSVLRIHNISASVTAADGTCVLVDSKSSASCSWQLTTQNQAALVIPSDRAVISSGTVACVNNLTTAEGGATAVPAVYQATDMLPQEWTNGYLIAVESLQLAAQASGSFAASDNVTVSVVMECTVETLSSAAAMALALSQQGN